MYQYIKLLHSDWLRAMQFSGDIHVLQKRSDSLQKEVITKHSHQSMSKQSQRQPIKCVLCLDVFFFFFHVYDQ